MCHKLSLCTLSNAFSKSIKFTWSCLCHSALCSMMFRKANICSIQLLPFLNPACSFLNVESTAVDNLLMITLARILLGIDKRVIPRQLLQSLRLPFFGILIITPLVHSLGTQASLQIVLKSGSNISAAVSGSVLNNSAFKLSSPGALLFFSFLIAATISSLVGSSMLISRSISP